MHAAVAIEYGEKDPAIELRTDWPRPVRSDGKRELLVKVLASSTAAGDVHMISGRVSFVLRPPSFPFVVGKDVCGIVVEADQDSAFKPGDCVVGSRDYLCYGGMAEFAVLEEARSCLKPSSLDNIIAASCPDSSVTALRAVECASLKNGDRVLVLGGSGGVGSAVVQLVTLAYPSFLASTSTQEDMLKGLGVHQVVNYHEQDWWAVKDFVEQPFDVVIDCVGGGDHFEKSRAVLKSRWSGGRFVAVVAGDPLPVVQSALQLAGFVGGMLWPPLKSILSPWIPHYRMLVSSTTADYLSKVLALVDSGKITVVLDPASPLPFTTEGVKKAFTLQASRHAHGKVVVQIAKDE